MNKKKSKALAFLLAASLLVPSANGIVSAAELRGNDVVVEEQAEGTTGSDATTGGETTEAITTKSVKNKSELESALKEESVTEIVITEGFNVEGKSIDVDKPGVIIKGDNGVKLTGTSIFNIATDATISNLELNNNVADAGNVINITSGATAKIEGCKFTGEKVVNLINCDSNSKLKFIGNNVNLIARAMIVGVTNGSEIKNNEINLKQENYDDEGSRTGVLSVTAKAGGEGVEISGNTFRKANRVIGVDWSNLEGEKFNIKNNKFIETRYAFEVGSEDPDNKGKSYDLSDNYYIYKNNVGPLRIEDASSKENHLGDGNPTELKIEDKTPLNIAVGPYYTKYENGNLSGVAHAGVATVNGKDYARLEKAIKAAKPGNTVELVSDIDVPEWNQIWNIKGITIDGVGHTIKVGKIESLDNHDAVFHSAGGNTFKNLTINLATVGGGQAQGTRAISASSGDVINNVKIIGASYGITAGKGCEKLTVTNSNISGAGHGIYLEGATDATVEIKNNIFDGCGYASILYSKNATFEGNTVKGGKVNIVHESNVVQKNTFTTDEEGNSSRVKFYTEGNKETFKYNKLIEGSNGKIGSTVTFATANENSGVAIEPRKVDFSLNYLGDKGKFGEIIPNVNPDVINDIKGQVFSRPGDVDNYLNGTPSKPIKPVYDHTSIIGKDRYDTAAKIADKLGSYDSVVLVNATSTMSDGLSASGLAGKEKGAILLTKKDSIPKVTMDRLKKVKKVYIIGGENAISAKVANEITAAGIKVERIGGKNRVETSELVAKKLGNYKKAFVVNGFKGEADAMSASSVAAKNGAPILLTNGKTSTHDKKSGVKYYVVGGNNVVNKSIANKYNAEVLAGDDRYETNREVINEFYGESETLYFANGETLVDALTASTLSKNDGLVLVGRKSDNKILNKKNTIQVGGIKFSVDFEK